MNKIQKIEIKAENTAAHPLEYKEELLPPNIEMPAKEIADVLVREKICPRLLIWPPQVIWKEEREDERLGLPERLTVSHYGSAGLNQNLRKLAESAPGIEKIWQITQKLPSLTELLSEERDNE